MIYFAALHIIRLSVPPLRSGKPPLRSGKPSRRSAVPPSRRPAVPLRKAVAQPHISFRTWREIVQILQSAAASDFEADPAIGSGERF